MQPLRSGRLLDTPREAARFVSLIGYDRHSVVGNTERTEMWTHTNAFLARNSGVCRTFVLRGKYFILFLRIVKIMQCFSVVYCLVLVSMLMFVCIE